MFKIYDDHGMCSSDFSKQHYQCFVVSMLLILTMEGSGSFFQCLLVFFFFHLYSDSLLPEYEHHICIRINYTSVLFIDFAWVLTLPRGPLMEV